MEHVTEPVGKHDPTGPLGHYAHTVWHVAGAFISVIAGWSTLNVPLADSGLAVLNHHAGPILAYLAKLTRQG